MCLRAVPLGFNDNIYHENNISKMSNFDVFSLLEFRKSDITNASKKNLLIPVSRGENKVCDATGREVKSFPDITPLLQRLHSEGYKLGIASE